MGRRSVRVRTSLFAHPRIQRVVLGVQAMDQARLARHLRSQEKAQEEARWRSFSHYRERM